MPRYVGLDIHKKTVVYCILGAGGTVLDRGQFPCLKPALESFGEKTLQGDDHVALEATTHCWAVVDLLEPFVEKIAVSNPLQTRAIAAAKIKTDRLDAQILAELLRTGFLPEVWTPDALTRRQRRMTHRRASLVRQRTAVKNRIHSTLAMRLIAVPNLFSKKGLEALGRLDLDEEARQAVESDLRLLEALGREIEALEEAIAQLAYESEDVRLLMTLPGVDVTVAMGLRAAWGSIDRFPTADKAAAYLGLVPSTRQSGDHCYHGPITKQGRSHARWLLIQAAQHLDRNPGPLGVFFRRLAQKKNRNVAVVATARKMAVIAWNMLRNREPYRYALPRPTDEKLARLRVRATGKRRKSGPKKGTSRSENYGTGRRTRRIKSLPEIYEGENLPPAEENLSKGEQRALAEQKLTDFAESLRTPSHIQRKVPTATEKNQPKAER